MPKSERLPKGEQAKMTEEAKKMIEYILRRIRKPTLVIDENTPLVTSGLVDSMALGEVVLELEDLTNTRIPPGAVKPKDLDTIAKMFATAQRVGKPRKELRRYTADHCRTGTYRPPIRTGTRASWAPAAPAS